MPLAIGLEPMSPAGSIVENGMDLIRHGFEHVLQALPGLLPVCFLDELGHGKLACAVDANEQKQFALSAPHFGYAPSRACKYALPGSGSGRSRLSTNVSFVCRPTDRVAFELLPLRLVASHVRQSRETVALQAPMQRRPCQIRDGRLQSIKAVLQRQQRVPPKSDNDRLLRLSQDLRAGLSQSRLEILKRLALAPLRDCLGVDPLLSAQRRERSLPLSGPCYA